MKKDRTKDKFLQKLREGNNVSTACKALGLSRQTVYRWCREDSSFEHEMTEAINEGEGFLNDFVENRIVKAIENGDMGTAKFWASRRHPKFKAENSTQRGNIIKSEEELERQRLQAKMDEPANAPKSVIKRIHEKAVKDAAEALEKINKEIEEDRKREEG